MLPEDDDNRKPARVTAARVEHLQLEPLGVAELRDYIAQLQAEIARAEAAIARKQGHRTAADSVFRKA
jgi:uncharacterized small protein (DUF1192 family)